MFSGIRYLLGYTDPPPDDNELCRSEKNEAVIDQQQQQPSIADATEALAEECEKEQDAEVTLVSEPNCASTFVEVEFESSTCKVNRNQTPTIVEDEDAEYVAENEDTIDDIVVVPDEVKVRNECVERDASAPAAVDATVASTSSSLGSGSGSNSGVDLSDFSEIDESWYVIPPACFNSKTKKSDEEAKNVGGTVKIDARENALIEHPSIYIAASSQSNQTQALPPKKQYSIVAQSTGSPISILASKDASKANSKAMAVKFVNKSNVNCIASDTCVLITRSPEPKPIVVAPSSQVKTQSQIRTQSPIKPPTPPLTSSQLPTKDFTEYKVAKKRSLSKQQKNSAPLLHIEKKKSKKAWENKFIVTNWYYDEDQDEMNGDFDNLFESQEQKKPTKATPTLKFKKTNATPKSAVQTAPKDDTVKHSSDHEEFPALVKIEAPAAQQTRVMGTEREQVELKSDANADDSTSAVERKAKTQVRPLDPERQPNWQLRRKRIKRRTISNASSGPVSKQAAREKANAEITQQSENRGAASNNPSLSLVDRIGSSLVANLTNLANGFSGTMPPSQSRTALSESNRINTAIAKRSMCEPNFVARRKLSKSFLDRQNDCAKYGAVNRRSDRRLKMYTTPNGVSINRKVHTNIH